MHQISLFQFLFQSPSHNFESVNVWSISVVIHLSVKMLNTFIYMFHKMSSSFLPQLVPATYYTFLIRLTLGICMSYRLALVIFVTIIY